jgi:hypothetical protein
LFSYLFNLCAELFPDSQIHAKAAVAKSRIEEVTDANLPWTTKDHLVALFGRISHMRAVDRTLGLLPGATLSAFKSLWPGEPVPETTDLIAERLQEAGRRLSEWRRSAARAGADMASRFACSWYDNLDLDALHSMRDDAPTNKDPVKDAARRARAYQLASYAATSTFIPVPAGIVEELSDGEDEETGDDEAEAEAEVPEEPVAGSPEQAPEAPAAPDAPVQTPVIPQRAREDSAPL